MDKLPSEMAKKESNVNITQVSREMNISKDIGSHSQSNLESSREMRHETFQTLVRESVKAKRFNISDIKMDELDLCVLSEKNDFN